MHDFTRLNEAILTTLNAGVASLTAQSPDLAFIACGVAEDLTGFFLAGASASWLIETQQDAETAELAWWPSEWPLVGEDPTDTPPGRVTSAIWELSGTQASLDGTGSEIDDEAYDELRTDYEERIIWALQELQAQGALRNSDGHDVWVWIHSADNAFEELDASSFAELQDEALAADFADRWGAGGQRLLSRIAARSATNS